MSYSTHRLHPLYRIWPLHVYATLLAFHVDSLRGSRRIETGFVWEPEP